MKTSPRLLIPAALALALTLTACLGGDDEDSSGRLPDLVTRIDSINREEGWVRLRDDYYYCDLGESIHDTDLYEEYYAIGGGKLSWTWGEEACMAEVFQGTSSDIVGTWKADPPALDTLSMSLSCREEVAERSFINGFARNLSITEKITETKIVNSATGEPCVAESEAWWMSVAMAGAFTEEVETTVANCNSATLTRVSDDATATLTASIAGGRSKVTFKTGNLTCMASLPLSDEQPEDCSGGGAEEAFYGCVAATGFFGEGWGGLEKTAATAQKRHRLLRSLRAPR